MRHTLPLLLAAALLAGAPARADADEVHLTTGRSIKGTVIEESDRQVVVKTPQGKLTLPRHLVKSIERQSEGRTNLELARQRAAQGSLKLAARLYEKAARDADPAIARPARSELAALRERMAAEEARASGPAGSAPTDSGPADPGAAAPPPGRLPAGRRPAESSGEARGLILGGGGFADEQRAKEVVLALRQGKPAQAAKLLDAVKEEWGKDRSWTYLVGRAMELSRRGNMARRVYQGLLGGSVDRNLPTPWLGELARSQAAGVSLTPKSPAANDTWRRIETEHFTIFHPFERVEPWFSRAPEEAMDLALKDLEIDPDELVLSGRVLIYLFESAEAYQEGGGMELAGGHAALRLAPDGLLKTISVYPNRRVYTITYRHEIAHTILRELYWHMPSWAHEGAAVYAEPLRGKGRLRATFAGCRQEKILPPLPELLRDEVPRGETNEEVHRYYAQASVTFDALVELTGGPREGLRLCERMGKIGALPALKEAGISLERLDAARDRAAAKQD